MSRRIVENKQVIFLPKEYAVGLHCEPHLISVRSKKDPMPEIYWYTGESRDDVREMETEDGRTVRLTFVTLPEESMYEPDAKEIDKIIDAVLYADGAGIVVHCKYGQSRSYTVAKWIEETFDYEIKTNHWCAGETYRTINHTLLRSLQRRYAARVKPSEAK